jgi:acetyl-CoA carboxylase biotin carboxyl carrier protein
VSTSSRRHARHAEATWKPSETGAVLASPVVGWFRPALAVGAVVTPAIALGIAEVLGQEIDLVAPAGTHGVIVAVAGSGAARAAVDHGAVLYAVDPDAAAAVAAATGATGATAAAGGGGLVFTAPTSGRFYGRSGPGKPAFVAVGDEISEGHTICLLEVMKTFNRVTYGGAGLPPRARVVEILVADESDVDAGAALLRVEPI